MTRSTLDTGITATLPDETLCRFCLRRECPGCIICTTCEGDPVCAESGTMCPTCDGAVMISPVLPNGRRIDAKWCLDCGTEHAPGIECPEYD